MFKNPYDYIGSMWIINDDPLILRSAINNLNITATLSCNIFTGSRGLGFGHLRGERIRVGVRRPFQKVDGL